MDLFSTLDFLFTKGCKGERGTQSNQVLPVITISWSRIVTGQAQVLSLDMFCENRLKGVTSKMAFATVGPGQVPYYPRNCSMEIGMIKGVSFSVWYRYHNLIS